MLPIPQVNERFRGLLGHSIVINHEIKDATIYFKLWDAQASTWRPIKQTYAWKNHDLRYRALRPMLLTVGEPTTAEPTPGHLFRVDSGNCQFHDNCVASPGWPGAYSNSDECSITVVSQAVITAESFETEFGYDYVTLAGKQYW